MYGLSKTFQCSVERSTGVKVSKSEIHCVLNDKDLKPHKVKMWLHSPDPQFREKVTKIASLYLDPPENGVVLYVDEKEGIQAIERKKSIASIEKKGQVWLDQEDKRHGTQTLIAALNIKNGEVFSQCGKPRKKADIAVFMKAVAEKYPDQKVYIVWDNLNIHQGYTWWEFNKRQGNRFHFLYTPVHASWVNQIKIWFGILQRKVIRHASFKSEEDLRDRVLRFTGWWNEKEAHPFRWQNRGYIKAA